MNEEQKDITTEVAKEVAKQIAGDVYKDGLKPAVKNVGKTLETITGFVNNAFIPVAVMVHGFDIIENNLKIELTKKLSKLSPKKIIQPPLYIAGPLLDKYKYFHNIPELSDMFINLLATSMNKDEVSRCHPSFINIVSELCPDEAKLLKVISSEAALPKLDIELEVNEPQRGFIRVYSNFTLLGEKGGLENIDFTPSYLNNLRRLGIISFSDSSSENYTDKSVYTNLENHEKIKELINNYSKTNKVSIKQGIIRITSFGQMFINAVSEKKYE